MAYDPFAPGALTVGETSEVLVDHQRADRRLPLEVWYPTDATPDALVLYSHTSNGHRRQSTFVCTHLASHGYVVAAVDHTGNTTHEAAERAAAGTSFTPRERDAYIQKIIADRVPDLRFLLDHMLAQNLNTRRAGIVGWSFGGWAALAFPEVDDRVQALVALAAGGNSKPLPGIIPATLTFQWRRETPTLFLVAEDDQYTPLAGQQELFERTPSSKRMFILRHADHGHFGDEIADAQGCSADQAHAFTRSLALVHLDATLRNLADAQQFLRAGAATALRDRGVDALEYQRR